MLTSMAMVLRKGNRRPWPSASEMRIGRVLVVDDNADALEMLATALPEMNGYELARAPRKPPRRCASSR